MKHLTIGKHLTLAALALIFTSALVVYENYFVENAEAGVLTHNQSSVTIRLHRRPRMHLAERYPTSSDVIGKTNPSLKASLRSLDPAKQTEAQENAEDEYRKRYAKWRMKQIKVQMRAIEKEKKEHHEHDLKMKKSREAEQRRVQKAQSIKEAPLNPWFGSKKATEEGTVDLKKEKAAAAAKPKDASRRVPLLKQLWHSIFG